MLEIEIVRENYSDYRAILRCIKNKKEIDTIEITGKIDCELCRRKFRDFIHPIIEWIVKKVHREKY